MSLQNTPNIEEILRQLKAAVLVVNHDLEVSYCNSAAEELFRLSRRQLQSTSLKEVILDGDLMHDSIIEALTKSENYQQRDARLLIAGQDWVTADLDISRLELGQESAILIEIRSDDRNHSIGLDSNEYSQHLAANTLIRGLGHEIKNPLGGLRGAAQLLTMELGDDSLKEYTSVIIKEADRLSALVDRMMAPHKQGQAKLINVHEPLEEAITLVTMEVGDSVQFIRNYDPSIPELMLFSDGIQQAFLNLIQNAVQAMDGSGSIELETRIVRNMLLGDQQQPLVARINFIDSGPGVPEHLKRKLFLPLVSGRASGTGLGLGVAQSLIQQHQGVIEYRDDQPKTTFSVYLPVTIMENS